MKTWLSNLGYGAALLVTIGLSVPALSQGPLGSLGTAGHARGTPDDVNRGRFTAMGGIFGQQRIDCVRCHGLDGTGNSSGAFPRLAGQNAWYLYKSLNDYFAGRRPSEVMAPIARSMTDQQMREVAAYYASLVESTEFAPPQSDVEERQLGGAIAATGLHQQDVPACSTCHGANGEGQPPVTPALAGQYAPYLEHQLLLWKRGDRGGDPLDVMSRIASAMTDEQIGAVSLYYATVRPAQWEADETAPENDNSILLRDGVPAVGSPALLPADGQFAPNVLPPYLPGRQEGRTLPETGNPAGTIDGQ